MITKCRPIEIMRKKFSDFDQYQDTENQVFLVGYEIDQEGNKKNVKIDISDVGLSQSSSFKAKKFEKISKGQYEDYSVGTSNIVMFDLTNCMDFIQVNSVSPEVLSECDSPEEGDGIVKHFIFDTINAKPGKKTKLLMRNVCPEDVDTVYVIFNDYIIAEVRQNQHVIIEILHTFDSEIIVARSEQLEIPN